jgi:hypothetical protein
MLNKTPFEDVFDSKMLFRHPSRCKIKVTSSDQVIQPNFNSIKQTRRGPTSRPHPHAAGSQLLKSNAFCFVLLFMTMPIMSLS